jgi:hypothetical protein
VNGYERKDENLASGDRQAMVRLAERNPTLTLMSDRVKRDSHLPVMDCVLQSRPSRTPGDNGPCTSHCPTWHLDIDEMVAEGDKVVCRNRWHGTSAQTGKRMEFHGFVAWRFEGDRIAERWATVTAPAETQ